MLKHLFIALALLPGTIFAQNRVQNYIDSQMKTDSLLINASVSINAIDGDGNTIASWNSDTPLLTASTMKTITTGVALEVLGSDYKFSTKIAYDGNIDKNGVLNGNLYIVGGGDPTLGSRDTIAFAADSIFGVWTNSIRAAGIKRINGKVIGDDRYLVDETIPGSWQWGDVGYDYGSGASGLAFAENLSYFEFEAGKEIGDPVSITPLDPYSPKMIYINEATTGEKGTGDDTRYRVSDLAPVGKFLGEYGIDRRKDTIAFSNKFGPITCANAFASFLANQGIINNGITDIKSELKANPNGVSCQDKLTYICETFSPELIEIVNVTNRISNNFFAETLLKSVGKALCGESDYYHATKAVREYIESRGVSVFGFTQDDGSGLSRENYVSSKFFCNYYTMMSKSATFAAFFESLPGPGRPGTLKSVLRNEDPELKATIRAKSGSLSGTRCYAGYVDSKERGLIKFAILVNNYSCPTRMVQPLIEGFMKELALYGATTDASQCDDNCCDK